MEFLGLVALILAVVAIAIWAGRGGENSVKAPDTALSNPGGGRDFGRLTAREQQAHEDMLREFNER